jgi:hypothetical protein
MIEKNVKEKYSVEFLRKLDENHKMIPLHYYAKKKIMRS